MTALWSLRIASMLEGISYLVLLFIAMPMKYVAGQPQWVSWAGRVHGGLFVALVLALVICASARKWDFGRSLRVLGMALVPFGAFVLDREFVRDLRSDEALSPRPS
jgi:integral membrane protein